MQIQNSQVPFIICYYEPGNEEQKNYCIKVINYLQTQKQIYSDIKESNIFSIFFILYGKTYLIKSDYNLSDESIYILNNRINQLYLKYFNNSYILENPYNPQKYYVNINDHENDKLYYNPRYPFSKYNIDIKINKELENMCHIGKIMKMKMKEEKIKNPNNYIEVKDALKLERDDPELFALGLLGNVLIENGTEVLIEKDGNLINDNLGEDTTFLQFLSNGLIRKKKYDLHFDFGNQKNEEILSEKNEYEKFKEDLLEKLSRDYNIPINKIIVTFPQKGSVNIQVIFQSDEFNNLDLDEFNKKFQNDVNFPKLQNLKEVHRTGIMEGCKLSRNQLDARGNRDIGWAEFEKRGKKEYYPPKNWIGIGLKVMDKYDHGDNTWMGTNNIKGEWCVAYHGVGRGKESKDVQKIINSIINDTFHAGPGQAYSTHDDMYHPGKKVGDGVYITPKIEMAQDYAGITSINDANYKTVLMVRVNPEVIRASSKMADYWVVNGTPDEIRPYRILYKKI